MLRPLCWLGKRLGLIALVLVGAAVALLAYTRVGSADISHGERLDQYTYKSSDCSGDSATDPINVVFYDDAGQSNIDGVFASFGWGDNGGATQYFKTNGNCHQMNGQPSSGQIQLTRYHARYAQGRNENGYVYADSLWGDYSVAAAHYEVVTLWTPTQDPGCGPPWDHAVPAGGFNEGRDNVVYNWVTNKGHAFGGYWYWGNTDPKKQCDGNYAQGSGWVAYIRVSTINNDYDGDGVPDSVDNCPYVYNPDQKASDAGPRLAPALPTGWASNPAQDPHGDACDPDSPPAYRTCSDPTDSDGDTILDCIEHLYNTCASAGDKTVDYSNCQTPADSDGDNCPDWLEMNDVLGDRRVNVGDQLLIAKVVAGLLPSDPISNLVIDVNHDGKLNIGDNLMVAKNTCSYRGYMGAHKCPCDPEP